MPTSATGRGSPARGSATGARRGRSTRRTTGTRCGPRGRDDDATGDPRHPRIESYSGALASTGGADPRRRSPGLHALVRPRTVRGARRARARRRAPDRCVHARRRARRRTATARRESFGPVLKQLVRARPRSPLRAPLKLAGHAAGLASLAARARRRRPDIVHWQWAPLPQLDFPVAATRLVQAGRSSRRTTCCRGAARAPSRAGARCTTAAIA